MESLICCLGVVDADVLSCAVAKNDVDSIGLLIDKYPDLMNRTHPLWSKPLLQVREMMVCRVRCFSLGPF